jgi:hypothetical protein
MIRDDQPTPQGMEAQFSPRTAKFAPRTAQELVLTSSPIARAGHWRMTIPLLIAVNLAVWSFVPHLPF